MGTRSRFGDRGSPTMTRQRIASSSNRVNRGGSFNNPAVNARSANRNNNAPTIRNNNLGLRPAKTSLRQIATVASRHRRAVHRDVQIRCRCQRAVRWPNSQRASGVVGPNGPSLPARSPCQTIGRLHVRPHARLVGGRRFNGRKSLPCDPTCMHRHASDELSGSRAMHPRGERVRVDAASSCRPTR